LTLSAFVLSHRNAPLGLRERFACGPGGTTASLRRLVRQGLATEAALLSTCHRIELYAFSADPPDPDRLGQFLCHDRGLDWELVQPFAGSLVGLEAAIHLFTVSAGLDSTVVGETEVLGQVKSAYTAAKKAGTMGPHLDGLFRWAIHVGRRVRKETPLGTARRSLGKTAVDVASAHLGGLDGRTVTILGAGIVARTVAERAHEAKANLIVCGRTPARARQLAGPRGQVLPLEQLGRSLADTDLLVCCAAAAKTLVNRHELQHAMAGRNGRRLVVVDLSVPRVVDVEANQIPGVELIDLESLAHEGVAENQALTVPIRDGLAIVNEEAQKFATWAAGRQAGAAIAALRGRVEEVCALELERRLSRHRSLSRAQAREVLSAALAKLLHAPTVATREAAARGDFELITNVCQIFGLDESAAMYGVEHHSRAVPRTIGRAPAPVYAAAGAPEGAPKE
jgi:glutamyl-tRNA reductase